MTTVRLPPMGQSTYWEKRRTTPGMTKRTQRVCMSLWKGQEQLTDPCKSLGSAWLFKSTAKVAALHRSVERGVFQVSQACRVCSRSQTSTQSLALVSSSVPGTGWAEQGGKEPKARSQARRSGLSHCIFVSTQQGRLLLSTEVNPGPSPPTEWLGPVT